MSSITRVFAGRLAGMVVRGPEIDAIGRVRDVVISVRHSGHSARALGIVVEMVNNRKIFLPMLRIAAIEPHEITLVGGSVSMRPFQSRSGELGINSDLIGSRVHVDDPDHPQLQGRVLEIADVELERTRTRDWVTSKVAVFTDKPKFSRRRPLDVVPWKNVHGINPGGVGSSDKTAELIAQFTEMRPADIATKMYELDTAQRERVAAELDDQRLADIMQELSEEKQAELLEAFDIERAADVLEEMDPDDAADLLGELPDAKADVLLELMDPEESAPVRRLMIFGDNTVGALMTSEPLIVTPHTTVAEALAMARNPDLVTSLSSIVFVVRPPTATPTGKYLGCVHLQRLLREPPASLVGGVLDPDLPPLYADDDQETAARYFAAYNLVCGPVVDDDQHLLGAVAVDDLIDHMLPDNWRDTGIRPDTP